MSSSVMILGEVLGDVFPERILIGGAPYNVARHCHAFGLDVSFQTAVGQDALGARVIAEIQACGLSAEGVQQVAGWPTGQVVVHFEPEGHRFEILDQQAYDAMDWPPVEAALAQSAPRLVYFGSLAIRHAPMRELVQRWLAQCSATVFCDINLRAPWYDADSLRTALQAADILKINHEELPEVARVLGMAPNRDIDALARQFLLAFNLSEIFVTCGAQGSFWQDVYGQAFRAPPMQLQEPFVDSVGAGDAYSAVVIRGLLSGWSRPTILTRAAWFATAICGVRGAVPEHQDFYSAFV